LAREALAAGFELIIAVGGDGNRQRSRLRLFSTVLGRRAEMRSSA